MYEVSQAGVIEALTARLARLERRNRRLAWAVGGVMGCLMVLVIAGARPAGVAEVVEAKQFLLRSPQGKVIAELGADPLHDEPYFHLYDQQGQVRLALSKTGLSICKPGDGVHTTNGQILLDREENGGCSLKFVDSEGRSRLQLGISKADAPGMQFWDKQLENRIMLAMDPETDRPSITLEDPAGARIQLGQTPGGTAAMILEDGKGKGAVRLLGGGRGEESSRLELDDVEGATRLSASLGDDGSPELTTRPKDGPPKSWPPKP